MQATQANIVTPFLRDKLNFDIIDESNGSNKANEDVNPANNIDKNNNGAKTSPTGSITLKICGKTTNIKLGPLVINSLIGTDDIKDMYPRIEKTPKATQIS